MRAKVKLLVSATAMLGGSILLPAATFAQSQPADQEAATGGDIIVTATRRSQTVSDVPSNISAVGGDTLEKAGVTDLNSFTRLVPGLVMRDEGPRVSGNQNSMVIRGLNADGRSNQDDDPAQTQASVSTYLGETPIFFPFKLIDIDRIEVLRGPQGTLYGSGSVGGTVRIIPAAPRTDAFAAEVNVEGALTRHSDDPSYELSAMLNIPLSDNLAFRMSGGYEYYGGFIDALGLVETVKTSRFDPGTLVLADPSDFLGSPAKPGQPEKDVNNAKTYFARAALRYDNDDGFDATLNYLFQRVQANDRTEHNPLFGSGANYVQYKDSREPQDAEINLANLEVHVDVGFAQMTSSTAYSETTTKSLSDSSGFLRTVYPQYYFGFPRLISPILRSQDRTSFTQEIRLVSPGGGSIDWLVGGYYNRSTLDYRIFQRMAGISDYVNQLYEISPPVPFGDVGASGGIDTASTELAGYGELTWHATDKLSLTAGTRVFRTTVHGTGGIALPFAENTFEYFETGEISGDPVDASLPLDSKDSGAIFRLSAAYDFSPQALLYATWAQGYRTGGSNALPRIDAAGNDNTPFLKFEPDTLNSYEVGLKGRIDRFDYAATAYWIDWSDMQQALVGNLGIAYIGNVPGARSRGFELSLNGQVARGFTVALGYTYTDAEVTKPFLLSLNEPGSLITPGLPLPGATKHVITASADYSVPLGSTLDLNLHGDISYRSKSQSTFRDIDIIVDGVDTYPGDLFIQFPSSTVLNLAASLEFERFSLGLFADNITSELGTNSGITAEYFGPKSQAYGVLRPRTIGLRAKFKFGG